MDPTTEEKIYNISRPCPKLAWVYFFRSLTTLFAFPLVFAPLFCKYFSLRYHIDTEGIGASWGILFKKQVYLTYARIQDIHVSRSLIERWFGLATVDIQTASGSATAELSIVGLEEYDEIRDFLYTRMRGARGEKSPDETESDDSTSETLDAYQLLCEIRDELRALRQEQMSRKQNDV